MARQKNKLTDKEFWRILRENGGLFARTARDIEKKFKVSYSRQAARNRASKNPLELADIEEENTDTAEEVLFELLKSEDQRIQADIAKFYLKTKGKQRGYVERIEQTGANGGAIQTETTHDITKLSIEKLKLLKEILQETKS